MTKKLLEQDKVKPGERKQRPSPAMDKIHEYGIDYICDLTAECATQQKIAEFIGVSVMSMMGYVESLPEYVVMYTRARELQADRHFEDILAIADDATSDHITGADGVERINNEAVSRSKLRVETRKWVAGKMNSKKYGDKLDVDAKVSTAHTVIIKDLSGRCSGGSGGVSGGSFTIAEDDE